MNQNELVDESDSNELLINLQWIINQTAMNY